VFDSVFDETSNNEEVYEGSAKPLVDWIFQGWVTIANKELQSSDPLSSSTFVHLMTNLPNPFLTK